MTAADMVQAAAGGHPALSTHPMVAERVETGMTSCRRRRSSSSSRPVLIVTGLVTHSLTTPFRTDALNRRASKRTHRLAFPPSVYVSAVLVPAGSPVAVDTAALERLGVRQILEVPSVPAPDGRGVHFERSGLGAAGATDIAAHRAAAQRAAAASNGWVGGSPAAAGLTRRNSI